jgi:hypothetical protein
MRGGLGFWPDRQEFGLSAHPALFFSDLAHDLRNHINLVGTSVSLSETITTCLLRQAR